MYDFAALYNSEVESSTGKYECQTVIFRPDGDGMQVIGQRSRVKGADRWDRWSVGSVDLNTLPPDNVEVFTDKDGKDTRTLNVSRVGMVSKKQKKGVVVAYNTGVILNDVDYVATSVKSGFVAVTHEELRDLMKSLKIEGTVSKRVTNCWEQEPRKVSEIATAGTQTVGGWISQATTFVTSRWGESVFPSLPRSQYTFAPYTGVVTPGAAGEKIVVEKRTFERFYTRPNGEKYFGRKIGEHEDVFVMTEARKHNENVLMFGPPGTGKTALAEAAYSADGDSGMITILGNAETEVADFVGSYTQRPGEGFVWVDGPLIEAMEQGKVLLVDEIGLIDPRVLSTLYSVMDGRGELKVTQNPDRGTVTAKEGFYVIAATNPHAPGVQLSEALISRFTVQVEVDSDYELAKHLKVNKAVVKAAAELDRKRMLGQLMWAPQLRELFAFARNEKIFGTTFAARSLVAGAPEMERDDVADAIGKAIKETITPLRMEG